MSPARTRATPFDRRAARRLIREAAAADAALEAQLKGGHLRLNLLVDQSRFEDANVAGQIVADLDRVGVAVTIEARPAVEYEKRLAAGRFDLALQRVVLQLPEGTAAMAGVLAAAGEGKLARQCVARGRCSPGAEKRITRGLLLIPLVHCSSRVFFDRRLQAFGVGPLGIIPYADISWKRR